MERRRDIYVMLLGDFSPCLEHVIHAYYMAKTKRDSLNFLEECDKIGIETTIRKGKVRIHLQVATTRRKTSMLNADEYRMMEYKSRFSELDLILLCFYTNNSKSLNNIPAKYLKEVQTWYPEVPYFLLGLEINQWKDGMLSILRDTINVEDRWLKRDLDVFDKESKTFAKTIKAQSYLNCSVVTKDNIDKREIKLDEDDLMDFTDAEHILDKGVKFILKRLNRTCLKPF